MNSNNMTPDQEKTQQLLRPFVLATMDTESPYEMAKAFLRYERIRRLTPEQILKLLTAVLSEENFDHLMDLLILDAP